MPLINIIHDPVRKDRYDLLMKEVEQEGFEYKLWDAVKGLGTAKKNISKAHRNIVQHAKENNLGEVIIGEDDMHFPAKGSLQYFLNKKPKEFDLYLAGILTGSIASDNTTQSFAGLQLYIIHNRYYNTFLESNESVDIDWAQTRKGIFHVCNPFAIIQHETMSDNTKRIHFHVKLYRNRTIYNGHNG